MNRWQCVSLRKLCRAKSCHNDIKNRLLIPRQMLQPIMKKFLTLIMAAAVSAFGAMAQAPATQPTQNTCAKTEKCEKGHKCCKGDKAAKAPKTCNVKENGEKKCSDNVGGGKCTKGEGQKCCKDAKGGKCTKGEGQKCCKDAKGGKCTKGEGQKCCKDAKGGK